MDYQKLESYFGVNVDEYIEPDGSLSYLKNSHPMDNPAFPRKKTLEDCFYLGSTTLADYEAKLLYSLAMERNREIFSLFHRYLQIKADKEYALNSIVSRLNKPELTASLKFQGIEEKVVEANYRDVMPRNLKRHNVTRYSYINSILIPSLNAYQIAYKNNYRFKLPQATVDDYEDWKNVLISSNLNCSAFFRKSLSAYLDFSAFKKHAYITGKSGSGKTELLKLIAHHLITREDKGRTGGIIIDPHGDFSKEVAQFKECFENDRIIYCDSSLFPHKSFSINPFSRHYLSDEETELYAEYLCSAFEEIIADSSVTAQMKTLLKPCLCVLLFRPQSGLEDLQRFMIKGQNDDLIEFGKRLSNVGQAEFFKNAFESDKYESTKSAIYTRIQSLRNSRKFFRIVNKFGNLNLEEELKKGKIIIFNLSIGDLGEDVSSAIGRLILSQVKSIGYTRQKTPKKLRPQSFVIIDECHHYIGQSIEQTLTDLRKYGIYLTLSSQVAGYRMSTQLLNTVLSNTAVKIIGANANKTYSIMEKETGVKRDELDTLHNARFCIHIKDSNNTKKPFFFKAPSYCADNKNSMTQEQWRHTIDTAWSEIYRLNKKLDSVSSVDVEDSYQQKEKAQNIDDKPMFEL